MKKRNGNGRNELRREYNLSTLKGGVRGKYYERAMSGTNLVLIEPDIAEVFPDSATVNEALRGLMGNQKSRAKRPTATPPRGPRGRGNKTRAAR